MHENVSCPVRSNLNVRYKWTLKQDIKDSFVSSNQMISIQSEGIYQCEVEYNIRNASCFLVASIIKASIESTNITTTPDTAISGCLSVLQDIFCKLRNSLAYAFIHFMLHRNLLTLRKIADQSLCCNILRRII